MRNRIVKLCLLLAVLTVFCRSGERTGESFALFFTERDPRLLKKVQLPIRTTMLQPQQFTPPVDTVKPAPVEAKLEIAPVKNH